jgi:predicted ester cyclase
MSYYAESVVLQIPGLLMKGKEAVRDQFARPFITAFPGNRHIVKNMIFGPGVVNVEFSFEAQHKGAFAGHAATGARIKLPGCGVYEYDSAKRQITAGRMIIENHHGRLTGSPNYGPGATFVIMLPKADQEQRK